MRVNTEQIVSDLTRRLRRSTKFVRRSLLAWLAPYIPFLFVLLVPVLILVMLVAAVYAAFPGNASKGIQPVLAGVKSSAEDKKLRELYGKLCNEWNVKDTWLVNPNDPCVPEGPKFESTPEAPFHPNRGKGERLGFLADKSGQDDKLKMSWGQIHAAALYRAYSLKLPEIKEAEAKRVAEALHPYFYYKLSTVIVSGKDGTETYHVFLLVEAYTIQGHYQYHYEWRTRCSNGGCVTYEELVDVKQILPNRWQRLEDWIKKEYEVGDKDIVLARTAVWEASQGFDKQKEWLQWLLNSPGGAWYAISGAMVPPELMPLFEEAEKEFGIPWWFLAAVALKESSFDVRAENPKTHCYGLMQVSPENWKAYAPLLGFDPEADRDNPRAQIFVGTYILKMYLGNVDWNGDWKEQTLPGLVRYGGFVKVPPGSPYKTVEEWCRAEYASKIWEYAEQFKNVPAVWPVPGHYSISSYFGWRRHPIFGDWRHHDGIDIPAPQGTKVVSVSGGIVIYAGWWNGYGNVVCISDGVHMYLYAHLDTIDVIVNQPVRPEQQIGTVGRTGDSTGPHLHFGVTAGGVISPVRTDPGAKFIDPLLVIKAREA